MAAEKDELESTIKHLGPLYCGMPGGHEIYGVVYSGMFPASAINKVTSFNFRDSDVIVATYPKAGTSWLQEIMYLLHTKCDVESSSTKGLGEKVPFLEYMRDDGTLSISLLEEAPSPRLIKTHLYRHYFDKVLKEKNTKFIVVMRNLKDTLTSYYDFYKKLFGLGRYKGTFNEFYELFKENKLNHGSWFDFNLGWWEVRDHPNVIMVKYSDLKKDLRGTVQTLDEFLKTENTSETLYEITKNVTFDAMLENNPKHSHYLAKGRSGGWEEYFTEELIQSLDSIYKERMCHSDLTFDE